MTQPALPPGAIPSDLPGMPGAYTLPAGTSQPKADLPPHDAGAERAVLVVALSTPEALGAAMTIAPPSMYYDRVRQRIATAVTDIIRRGELPDLTTVTRWLTDHATTGLLAPSESVELMALREMPYVGSPEQHARVIRDHYIRRQRISVEQWRIAQLQEGKRPLEDVNAEADERLEVLTGAIEREPLEPPTAAEPLRGLDCLSRVAVVGRNRFLELASIPIQYIWQDLVVAGTIVGIAAPPSEGKTTLLFLLLAARLNPGEAVTLLGHELSPAPAGQWVVLIEGEHGEASAARKLVSSFELLGLDDSGLDRLILVARKAVRLGSPEWLDIVRLVKAGLVSDIALDTVARVAPANADNEAEQVAIFDTVAQAIEQAPDGCQPTCWAIMHTRKGEANSLADVSGSTQRTGQADSVFMLKAEKTDGRVDSVKVTFAKLRETPDEYPEPEAFAIVNRADGKRELRQGVVAPSEDTRPLETQILEQLAVCARTKNWLARHLNKNKDLIEDAISNLFRARQIRTTDIEVKGRKWKAFEPSTNTERARNEGFDE